MPLPYNSDVTPAGQRSEAGEGAEDTEGLSKKELLERARELEIEGRSNMTKDELAKAVEEAEGQ